MCLNTITKAFNPPDPKVRTGWKYVEKTSGGRLVPAYKNRSYRAAYTTDWQTAFEEDVSTNQLTVGYDMRPKYTSGFHVFPTREEARKAKRILLKSCYGYGVMARLAADGKLKLIKVEVKDVTYEGIDGTNSDAAYLDAKIKTLVAKQIRLVREVKD